MVDHACDLTERYLERALADPEYLDFRTLREDFLEDSGQGSSDRDARTYDGGTYDGGTRDASTYDDSTYDGSGHDDRPVPFNRIMIATFFLVGMDNAHWLIAWCDGQGIDWTLAMVVIAGRQGRPTAGVTWRTSSVAAIVLAASRGQAAAGAALHRPARTGVRHPRRRRPERGGRPGAADARPVGRHPRRRTCCRTCGRINCRAYCRTGLRTAQDAPSTEATIGPAESPPWPPCRTIAAAETWSR